MTERVGDFALFERAAARFSDLVYISTRDRRLAADDVNHARLLAFYRGELAEVDVTEWNVAAVCVVKTPEEKLVAIGEDGEVLTYVGGRSNHERIEPRPATLRGLGVVEGRAVACGMKRQVFRRVTEGRWEPMHAPQEPDEGVSGFEAVDGYSDSEIYCVGWRGEVWEWNGTTWLHHPSPTNLILTSVVCTGADLVYACGQKGTLLRGRHDSWERIEFESPNEDFWDLAWFQGALYVSSMTALYRLEGSQLVPVEFGTDRPATFHRLTHAQGVLWSVGAGDVFSFDGNRWTRVD